MIKTAILNVTAIEPRLKHPTIFDHFDALLPGEGFIISNDHDPRPLYYQLLGERGNFFTWEYLESGPMHWEVRIAKSPAEMSTETVGEIAAKDIRKAEAMKKMGIDFCCGGKKTLAEVVTDMGLNLEQVKIQLEAVDQYAAPSTVHDFKSWDIGFLADYIYNVHHRYIREQGPLLTELANKVASRHGNEHPELIPLAEGIEAFMEDLFQHIVKEEESLFPVAKSMVAGGSVSTEGIQHTITDFEAEHAHAGQELQQFRALTKDYELPANACNSYTYLFEKIKDFESDLFQHIHLENNILFPKIKASQKEHYS